MITQTESGALITRDLLGIDYTKELDLDVHVPFGFEKRLDLKSGKVYIERRKSSNTSQSSEQKHRIDDQMIPKLQDLNQPSESTTPLTLFDTDLDLKLDSLSSSSSSSSPYQSVRTHNEVKFALERVEKETNKKRSISMSESCVSPASNSSSSIKETKIDNHNNDNDNDDASFEAYATGCPNCLLYVLIFPTKPKCPRCNMIVPSVMLMKKPRIDLNIMI